MRRSKSSGMSAISAEHQHHHSGHRGGHHRAAEGGAAGKHARAQQDPEDHEGPQVDQVGEREEGHHPAGRAAPGHPRLAQRPVGEHEPARSRGGEDPRGGQPRHGDLVGRPQVEPPVDLVVDGAREDPLEQRHVGREGQDVEADRGHDPVPRGVVDAVERLSGAQDRRDQHVDRDDHQDHPEHPEQDLAPVVQERAERSYLCVVVLLSGPLVFLELELEVALLVAYAGLARPHQPARGSRRRIAPPSSRAAGSARGARRQIPSASASPASRSMT